jgi:hypothetical protein
MTTERYGPCRYTSPDHDGRGLIFSSYRGPDLVGVGGALPSSRMGEGKTYGSLVGSSMAAVGSGVTSAIVGNGVGVDVWVGVGVVDGVGLGRAALDAVGSAVVSSTSGEIGVGSTVAR